MRLKMAFWRQYELDFQEVKLAYLNWAVGYVKEPIPVHRHLFYWEHQKTTEIYAGQIEMGTRKQTDYLADFWQRKLIVSDPIAPIKCENEGYIGRQRM